MSDNSNNYEDGSDCSVNNNNAETFYYFAYGSNMLSERIHIGNPSAVHRDAARLDGYRLTFNLYGESWHGAPATLIPDEKAYVWGVVWELSMEDMKNLDRQESWYDKLEVDVLMRSTGKLQRCRTYMMTKPLQGDRRPSAIYLDVIIRGAMEYNLPKDYIENLRKIVDNGYYGPISIPLPKPRRG